MNLVSVLIAPAVVALSVPADANHALRIAIAVVAGLIAIGPVVISKLRGDGLVLEDGGDGGAGDGEPEGAQQQTSVKS